MNEIELKTKIEELEQEIREMKVSRNAEFEEFEEQEQEHIIWDTSSTTEQMLWAKSTSYTTKHPQFINKRTGKIIIFKCSIKEWGEKYKPRECKGDNWVYGGDGVPDVMMPISLLKEINKILSIFIIPVSLVDALSTYLIEPKPASQQQTERTGKEKTTTYKTPIRSQAGQKIKDYLADRREPQAATNIVNALEIKTETVYEELNRLEKQGEIASKKGEDGIWEYFLL